VAAVVPQLASGTATATDTTRSNIKKIKFKTEDSHHVGKCWKCYNTPTSGQIEMKLR